MSKAIVKYDEVFKIAEAMAKSKFFSDSRETVKAVVKIIAGQEIGLGAFSSMTGIHIIQGKPALGANVIATLIKNDDRYDYKVAMLTDKVCEIIFYEHGEEVGISSFSMGEAAKASLSHKDVWKKYPRNMLFARAISNGARWYAAGIFGGMPVYVPEELGVENIDGDGNIIDAELHDPAEPVLLFARKNDVDESTAKLEDSNDESTVEEIEKVEEVEIIEGEIVDIDIPESPKPLPEFEREVIPPDENLSWSPDDADRKAVKQLIEAGMSNDKIRERLNLPLPILLKYRKELNL